MKKVLIFTVQHLEKYRSTVQLAYRGWHWVNRQEELLTGRGKGGRRWWNWKIVSNRKWRTSCSFTHAWPWWNSYSHLWNFTTWRSVCRRLSIIVLEYDISLQSSKAPEVILKHSEVSPKQCNVLSFFSSMDYSYSSPLRVFERQHPCTLSGL